MHSEGSLKLPNVLYKLYHTIIFYCKPNFKYYNTLK